MRLAGTLDGNTSPNLPGLMESGFPTLARILWPRLPFILRVSNGQQSGAR